MNYPSRQQEPTMTKLAPIALAVAAYRGTRNLCSDSTSRC